MTRGGAGAAVSLAALAVLCGCKPQNDPDRLCQSASLDKQDVSLRGAIYDVTAWRDVGRDIVLQQLARVEAHLKAYDRGGECRPDPREFTFRWRFTPEGSVAADSIRVEAGGSRVEFIPVSLQLSQVFVDVSHPRWGKMTAQTDPLPVYTVEQAAINRLLNDVLRLYEPGKPLAPRLRELESRLGGAMDAIHQDDYALATRQVQGFRDEVAVLQKAEPAWAPVLARTDAVLEQLKSRSSAPPSTNP